VPESRLPVSILRILQRLRPSEETLFLVLSVFAGALAGVAVVGYHSFLEWMFSLTVARYVESPHNWHLIVLPVLGSLIAGVILARIRNARGSGLNQVKVALIAHDGYVSLKGTLGKFFASAIGIGMGLPLGPEDPAVHIGGGIASSLGRLLSLPKKRLQQLVAVGAAAGLAGAFNTPVTAVIFTLEEVVGDINAPVLGSTIVATVTAVIVRRALLGTGPLFHVPQYQFAGVSELGFYALLGVVGGLISAGFSSAVTSLRAAVGKVPRGKWIDIVAPGGALVAGLLIFMAPKVAGVGYHWVDDVLNGRMLLTAAMMLLVCKIVGTGVVFATGNSGGMFAPVLFIGAMLGATVGGVGHILLPNEINNVPAFALVGMGVTFAGIIRAPMTSVFMIFEVTQDYQIMLPVMLANTIAYAVARAFGRESMFEVLAAQDGVYLPGKDDRQLQDLTVQQAMRQPLQVFAGEMTVAEALQSPRLESARAVMVLDQGRLICAVTQPLLMKCHAEGRAASQLRDVGAPVAGYRVFPDQPLSLALARLGAGAFVLPVVSRVDVEQLLGIVTSEDVLQAYGLAQTPEIRQKQVVPEAREMQ
jgi:CIC family chloride channel protein